MHGFRYSLEECKDFSLDEWKATNSSNQEHNPESKLLPATPRPFGAWFEKHIGLDRPIPVFAYFSIFSQWFLRATPLSKLETASAKLS